jgi:hypothetical protein
VRLNTNVHLHSVWQDPFLGLRISILPEYLAEV